VRTFLWWFGMGAMTTLAVLMVQGGVHDLLYAPRPGNRGEYVTFTMTILGGGLLAGCLALIMNRLR
jgi:quinol-cytochrome oxidoreductase complex cytochrome b subunit